MTGFTFGFYDSLNHDRRYNALQMSSIFDGVILDGVYANIYEQFKVVPGSGMKVVVKSGRAWFDHTWTLNTKDQILKLDAADPVYNRIDAVVIEVNHNKTGSRARTNTLMVVKGNNAISPAKPVLVNTDMVKQYVLAYITVKTSVTSIVAGDIDYMVGRTGDGGPAFVKGALETISAQPYFNRWESEFNTWFNELEDKLSGNVAAKLQLQIDNLNDKINDVASSSGGTVGEVRESYSDLSAGNSGWLPCDGRYVKASDYPELARLIGNSAGVGFDKVSKSYSNLQPFSGAEQNECRCVSFGSGSSQVVYFSYRDPDHWGTSRTYRIDRNANAKVLKTGSSYDVTITGVGKNVLFSVYQSSINSALKLIAYTLPDSSGTINELSIQTVASSEDEDDWGFVDYYYNSANGSTYVMFVRSLGGGTTADDFYIFEIMSSGAILKKDGYITSSLYIPMMFGSKIYYKNATGKYLEASLTVNSIAASSFNEVTSQNIKNLIDVSPSNAGAIKRKPEDHNKAVIIGKNKYSTVIVSGSSATVNTYSITTPDSYAFDVGTIGTVTMLSSNKIIAYKRRPNFSETGYYICTSNSVSKYTDNSCNYAWRSETDMTVLVTISGSNVTIDVAALASGDSFRLPNRNTSHGDASLVDLEGVSTNIYIKAK